MRAKDRRDLADRRLRLQEKWLVEMADGQKKNTWVLIDDLKELVGLVRRCCVFKSDAYARQPDGPVVPYPRQLYEDLKSAMAPVTKHGSRVQNEALRERVKKFSEFGQAIETIASREQAEAMLAALESDWRALHDVLSAHLRELESKLPAAIR